MVTKGSKFCIKIDYLKLENQNYTIYNLTESKLHLNQDLNLYLELSKETRRKKILNIIVGLDYGII